MDDYIEISKLNDFMFCPISIYFHGLYGDTDKLLYQNEKQINGTKSHEVIDTFKYSNKKDILQGVYVCSNNYHLIGKIDLFNVSSGKLIERKKNIKTIYDGYVFQIFAQYFCLKEMGYNVKKLILYSADTNKSFSVQTPEKNPEMFDRFLNLLTQMKSFDISSFIQENIQKCKNCIYEPACDRSLI